MCRLRNRVRRARRTYKVAAIVCQDRETWAHRILGSGAPRTSSDVIIMPTFGLGMTKSFAIRRGISLLVFIALAIATRGAVLRVPEDHLRIQDGLNALTDGDTLSVAPAEYFEALVGPQNRHYWIIGRADSTQSPPTPCVDPSPLNGATHLACLTLPAGSTVAIENISFRNRHSMFPREGSSVGGVLNRATALSLLNCVFDSTYRGLYPNSGDLAVTGCQFIHNSFACLVDVEPGQTVVRNSSFSGSDILAIFVDSTLVEDCDFVSCQCSEWVWLLGNHITVRGCRFGSQIGDMHSMLWTGESSDLTIEHNVFEELSLSGASIIYHGDNSDSTRISSNVFRQLGGWTLAGGAGVVVNGPNVLLDSNCFDSCTGFGRTAFSCIQADSMNAILNNVVNGSEDEAPAIRFVNARGSRMANSRFHHVDYALAANNPTSAERNWWGDSTGPYHQQLNPEGLGGEITGPVDFIPWLTDTTENVDGAPQFLPSTFALSAFPNPFNSAITLEFVATKAEHLALEIFDLTGRHVATVADEDFQVGIHRRSWNAHNEASGIYFARLAGSGQRAWLEKLVLLK